MTKSLSLVSQIGTRPSSQDRDQDQCYKTKTTARKSKTKTELYWSETGLATRPKSQTTSLVMHRLLSFVSNTLHSYSRRFACKQ